MKVTRTSPLTGKTATLELDITPEQVAAYAGGAKIQDAFPHLSADDREFYKTGYTAADWKAMFPPSCDACDTPSADLVRVNTSAGEGDFCPACRGVKAEE